MAGLVIGACGGGEKDSALAGPGVPYPDPTCEGWYGSPNDTTGLDAETCRAEVPGGDGTWTPPGWTADQVADLRTWTLVAPPAVPSSDPYEGPALTPDETSLCGAVLDEEARSYTLDTYASAAAAADGGAVITHGGACGLCSSLADLAVYAGISDLTGPVRQCGVEGLSGGLEATDACLQELGFSAPCARIWAWNARHTQESCLDDCLALLEAPYHEPDGSLNACLQCDEDESGPVFKTVAGRTRRNSGLATALCRPCDTVWRVEHEGVR